MMILGKVIDGRKSINEATCQIAKFVNSSIAKERPPTANVFTSFHIDINE